MKQFYGTKKLNAKPMTRGEYNAFRGWELPANENGEDKGYLVEYLDGGKANHPDFAGYISWSPKDVFEAAYQPTNALSFGHAIVALKAGCSVARSGWNGKGMYLDLQTPTDTSKITLPYIYMKTACNNYVPWLASQTDVLANDWQIVGIDKVKE